MKINKYTIKGEELVTIELSVEDAKILRNTLKRSPEYQEFKKKMFKRLTDVLSK